MRDLLPWVSGGVLAGAAVLAAGCANPGQPRPPSLGLPQIVADLAAERVGDKVHLHWTTPAVTTDNLPVKAGMSAVLCRQVASGPGVRASCGGIRTVPVSPGATLYADALPASLTSGSAGLLAYRVELLNAAGRGAGRSAEADTASGAAPVSVGGFGAAAVRGGVRLTWTPGPGQADAIEVDRVDTAPVPAWKPGKSAPPLGRGERTPAEVHLSAKAAAEPDRGGAVDRSARKGATYRYMAERVSRLEVAGHAVEMRSEPSAPVTVTVLDTFPPEPPVGLASAAAGAETPAIDLSWQPGAEPDLAGYNVYRREMDAKRPGAGEWVRLNASPVPIPGFRDVTARPGGRYGYRVTAVDGDGNESAPGTEVQGSPGTR